MSENNDGLKYSLIFKKGNTLICELSNVSEIEAYDYASKSLKELEQIGKIVNEYSFETMDETEFGVFADIVLDDGNVCSYYIVPQMGNERYLNKKE